MPSNPFAPPNANVIDAVAEAAARKPSAVWLMQALAMLVVGLGVIAFAVLTREAVVGVMAADWTGLLPRYLLFGGFIVCATFVVVGVQRRRPWARWLGVALMSTWLVLGGAFCWFAVSWEVEFFADSVSASTLRFVGVVGVSMVIFLVATLAAIFSSRARAWFSPHAGRPQPEARPQALP